MKMRQRSWLYKWLGIGIGVLLLTAASYSQDSEGKLVFKSCLFLEQLNSGGVFRNASAYIGALMILNDLLLLPFTAKAESYAYFKKEILKKEIFTLGQV